VDDKGRFVVHRQRLATIDLCTKFEISMLTDYEDMKGDEKCINLGCLGGYGHPKSSKT